MHSYSPRRSHYRVRTGGGCRRISRSTSRQAKRQDCVSLIYLVPDRIVLDDRLFAFVFYGGCRVYVRWWLTGTDYSWATLEVVVPPFIPRYPTRLPSYLPASRPVLSSSPAPACRGWFAFGLDLAGSSQLEAAFLAARDCSRAAAQSRRFAEFFSKDWNLTFKSGQTARQMLSLS